MHGLRKPRHAPMFACAHDAITYPSRHPTAALQCRLVAEGGDPVPQSRRTGGSEGIQTCVSVCRDREVTIALHSRLMTDLVTLAAARWALTSSATVLCSKGWRNCSPSAGRLSLSSRSNARRQDLLEGDMRKRIPLFSCHISADIQ